MYDVVILSQDFVIMSTTSSESNEGERYQAESDVFGKRYEISPVFRTKSEIDNWIANYKLELPNKIQALTEQRELALKTRKETNEKSIIALQNGTYDQTQHGAWSEITKSKWKEQMALHDQIQILKGEIKIVTYSSQYDMEWMKRDRDVRKMAWNLYGYNIPLFK